MGAATSKRRGGSAAAVLDFAVARILGDDAALGALPAVLDRMVATFGLRAALAFQPEQPAVLAVHPPGAADQALLARIGVMAMAQRDSAPVPLAVTLNGQPGSVLVARSVPVEGQCLCALALIGDAAASDDGYWDAETRASAQAVAAIVATQIRHASDMAALAERQALTRALIAKAPVAMLAMDADVRLVEFNPAAERLSGYRRGDVLGQPMTEILVPARDRPRFLEHIKTYLATGDPEEFTGQLRVAILRADGTERVAELTPVQITLGGQAIFAGFLRDLTELERSHAELADQTERLNCLIASAIPGVLSTDEQGTVTNVSQSFGTMFGLDEPLAGMPAVSVLRRVARAFDDPVRFTRRAVAVMRAGPGAGDRGRPGHLPGHPDRAGQAGPGGGQLIRREAGPARLPRGPAGTLRPGRARHRVAVDGGVGRAGAHPRPERRARAHPDRARPGGRKGPGAPRRCR